MKIQAILSMTATAEVSWLIWIFSLPYIQDWWFTLKRAHFFLKLGNKVKLQVVRNRRAFLDDVLTTAPDSTYFNDLQGATKQLKDFIGLYLRENDMIDISPFPANIQEVGEMADQWLRYGCYCQLRDPVHGIVQGQITLFENRFLVKGVRVRFQQFSGPHRVDKKLIKTCSLFTLRLTYVSWGGAAYTTDTSSYCWDITAAWILVQWTLNVPQIFSFYSNLTFDS